MKHYTTTKTSGKMNTKKGILLHHTGGSNNFEDMVSYFNNIRNKVSVHYVVGQNGEVASWNTHEHVLWHGGNGKVNGRIVNINYDKIGIEIVSRDGKKFTDVQRKRVHRLVQDIIYKEGTERHNIGKHADFSAYRGKWDVGENFYGGDWEKYLDTFDFSNDMTEQEKKAIDAVLAVNSSSWYQVSEERKQILSECNKKLNDTL